MTGRGPSVVEPGILQLFRIFTALEILLLLLRMGLERAFRSDFPLVQPVWPGLTFLALLLGYLSWRRLELALGRYYLPIALAASVGIRFSAPPAASGCASRRASAPRSWCAAPGS